MLASCSTVTLHLKAALLTARSALINDGNGPGIINTRVAALHGDMKPNAAVLKQGAAF